jgi:hypothetical protein
MFCFFLRLSTLTILRLSPFFLVQLKLTATPYTDPNPNPYTDPV